jgi:hypothetical protein
VAVAVHGITASAMAWSLVARALPREWTHVAPNLRWRGASAELPGTYGLDRHVDDICRLARALGDKVCGSATRWAHTSRCRPRRRTQTSSPADPHRWRPIIRLPADLDPDTVLDATLGPAIERLRQTYASDKEYLDVFRTHPALAERWGPDLEACARYDIAGEPGAVRSRVAIAAVRQDGREALTSAVDFAVAWKTLAVPTLLVLAPPAFRRSQPAGW